MPVGEMLRRMSAREFNEWRIVYYKLDPFGERRMDLRAGAVASPILNILKQAHFKNAKLSNVTDWLMELSDGKKKKQAPPQSAAEMKGLLKAIADAAAEANTKRKRK